MAENEPEELTPGTKAALREILNQPPRMTADMLRARDRELKTGISAEAEYREIKRRWRWKIIGFRIGRAWRELRLLWRKP